MKKQTLLLFLIFLVCFSFLDTFRCNSNEAELSRTRDDEDDGLDDEVLVHVGVILDMGSWQGQVVQSSISMAISDFYSLHESYKARVVLHVRNSQGDPFRALSVALNLLEDAKVGAILGAQTSLEAKFLAELGGRNNIPVISFSTPISFPISTRSPFFVQIGDDQTSQIKGIAALIELHKWRNVILIHQENENNLDNDNTIPYMAAFFEEKNIYISFTSAISAASEDDQIIEQLHELKTLQTTVFIVHLPHSLASRLFVNAKRLGMINEGYAWIVTSKTMNHFNSRDSSTIESMQGVIGFRSYIPASNEVHNFSSRLRRKFLADQAPDAMQSMQLNLGLLAYDVAWSLAKAAERVAMKVPCTSKLDARWNVSDSGIYGTSVYRSILLQEVLRSNFKGLGGEVRFINGKLISNTFEIVNVVGSGEKRVGFCTSTGRITREIHESNHGRQLSNDFTINLESIIWPGGSLTIPQGRMLQTSGKKLRIGLPVTKYPPLLMVERDTNTNATNVSGFCIDVFRAAMEGLNFQVEYEFIPFMDANGNSAGTYNEIVYQVYLKNFDAVVGDITITANRSLYVDFTMPFTDIGVGIVAPVTENKDMWIFFKPLTPQLWLTIVGFHILSGCAIWLIERQTPCNAAEFSPPESNGTFFSILVVRWERLRNKWAIFVAAASLFVLFILSSSYTATLASMMTVQHIELNSKRSYIGYLESSSIAKGAFISNLNFENYTLKPFPGPVEIANALSKGSKNGGVSAVLDEIPYIKIFLAKYPSDYYLVKTFSTTNGFAFGFPKGSPLVPDISREIARLRESGKLKLLENVWFKGQSSLTSWENTDNVRPLTPTNFGGLFLISGVLSVVAFLMFQIPLLYQYLQVVRNWMMNKVMVWRQVHVSLKNFRRMGALQSDAIHPQVQMT